MEEAFGAARDHCVIKTEGSTSTVSNVSYQQHTVLTTNGEEQRDEEPKGGGGKKATPKKKKDEKEEDKKSKDWKADSVERARRLPTRDCPICFDVEDLKARKHYVDQCPRLDSIQELVKDGTIAHYQKTGYNDDEDDDFLESVVF